MCHVPKANSLGTGLYAITIPMLLIRVCLLHRVYRLDAASRPKYTVCACQVKARSGAAGEEVFCTVTVPREQPDHRRRMFQRIAVDYLWLTSFLSLLFIFIISISTLSRTPAPHLLTP